MDKEQLIEQAYEKTQLLRKFLPALAFFAGVIWDSVTMGRVVKSLDLVILVIYYLGAALVMILQAKGVKPLWQPKFTLLIQFFFGGLFSALVVFYFKSSSFGNTLFFVISLGLVLVANEFLATRYARHRLTWTIFTLCGVMYLNFLIPHLFHSVLAIWFYLSCFLSLVVVYIIRRFASAEQRFLHLPKGKKLFFRSDLKDMSYPFLVVVVLVVLYNQQLIPPVPLVLKSSHVCLNLQKVEGDYQCQVEKQPFYRRFGFGEYTLHYSGAEKVYNLSSVFAPVGVKVDLEQRWFQEDKAGAWQKRGVVPVPMIGGRDNGWRVYSYIKQTVSPGRWKVETALQDGAVLAKNYFSLQPLVGESRELSWREVE